MNFESNLIQDMRMGVRFNLEIAERLYGIVQDTVSIGDCCSARKIMDAIFEGQMVAMNI